MGFGGGCCAAYSERVAWGSGRVPRCWKPISHAPSPELPIPSPAEARRRLSLGVDRELALRINPFAASARCTRFADDLDWHFHTSWLRILDRRSP